jgi:site-specific DNA recombinase
METELVTIDARLAKTEAAVDRYLNDYEENALDRDTLARRVDTLASQARQLRHRRDEVLLNLDTEPDEPDPAELAAIRDHIIEIITTGSPEERKALCEATIAELRITDRTTATPVFRIPLTTGTNNSALTGPQPASAEKKGVRVPQPRVHRRFQHTNTFATVVTCAFTLPLVRERASRTPRTTA